MISNNFTSYLVKNTDLKPALDQLNTDHKNNIIKVLKSLKTPTHIIQKLYFTDGHNHAAAELPLEYYWRNMSLDSKNEHWNKLTNAQKAAEESKEQASFNAYKQSISFNGFGTMAEFHTKYTILKKGTPLFTPNGIYSMVQSFVTKKQKENSIFSEIRINLIPMSVQITPEILKGFNKWSNLDEMEYSKFQSFKQSLNREDYKYMGQENLKAALKACKDMKISPTIISSILKHLDLKDNAEIQAEILIEFAEGGEGNFAIDFAGPERTKSEDNTLYDYHDVEKFKPILEKVILHIIKMHINRTPDKAIQGITYHIGEDRDNHNDFIQNTNPNEGRDATQEVIKLLDICLENPQLKEYCTKYPERKNPMLGRIGLGHANNANLIDTRILNTIVKNLVRQEVCITSLKKTGMLKESEVNSYIDKILSNLSNGINVILATDDATLFNNIKLADEYEHFNLTNGQIYQLLNAHAATAFTTESIRESLLNQILGKFFNALKNYYINGDGRQELIQALD